LNIDQSNFFVHSEFKGYDFDYASGNDIALIGLDQHQNWRLDDFIALNQEERLKQNNKNNYLSYF
jgi:hypothetical protein